MRKWIAVLILFQAVSTGGLLTLRRRLGMMPPWPEPQPPSGAGMARVVVLTRNPSHPVVTRIIETLSAIGLPSSVQKEIYALGPGSRLGMSPWPLRVVRGRRWEAVLAYWGDPVSWIERDGRIRWLMGAPLSLEGLQYLRAAVSFYLLGSYGSCSSTPGGPSDLMERLQGPAWPEFPKRGYNKP